MFARDRRLGLVLGLDIAFGKLQELMPGRPITLGAAQQFVNGVLLVLARRRRHRARRRRETVLLLSACSRRALLGIAVVLPIGGADMPVVISLLNAFTGLAAAATGFALDNTALIVAGTLVGASGSILTLLMADAMNRSIRRRRRGFGGGGVVEGASGAGSTRHRALHHAGDVAILLAYASRS